MSLPLRWSFPALLALALAGLPALQPDAAAAPRTPERADEVPVRGLIVRLREAAAHAEVQALPAQSAERERHQGRWQRVVEESDLPRGARGEAPRWRPVGRDQHLVDFERPMTRAQAVALAEKLAARPDVAWVDFNVRERRLQVPGDPFFANGSQWWLRPVGGTDQNVIADRLRGVAGFQTAWQRPLTGAQPAVAVLDTGITTHPELAGRLLPGYDFVSDLKFAGDGNGRDADPADPGDFVSSADRNDPHFAGCDLADSTWHGTVIAGMLAALTDNGEGVAALNWAGRVLPVRVAGKCGADVADIVDGMRWAAGLEVVGSPRNENPVRIVNVSFGGNAACSAAYQSAVDELKAKGVVVVAAAGNDHLTPARPASCLGVVGVAALNRDGFKASYSSFGSALTATGLAVAAGDDPDDDTARWNVLADPGIFSTINTGAQTPLASGYGYVSGTSFAAPQVAGAIALMLRVNDQLTWQQIIDGLRKTVRPHVTSPHIGACSWTNPGRCLCTTTTCGAGILDADQALVYAANPQTYVAPARQAAVIDNAELRQLAAAGPDRGPNPGSPPSSGSTGGSSSGGGGAMAWAWLAGLGLAAWALSAAGGRRRRRG